MTVPPDLDRWLPGPDVHVRHRRRAAAPAGALWRAGQAVRLDETRMLGRLVRWRIPGLAPDLAFGELFRQPPFTVLVEGESHLVSGLCGRIWSVDGDFAALDGPAGFRRWDVDGTARVLFAHWVQEAGDGTSELVSEARVEAVDRAAAVRLRALWAIVGVFEGLIGAEGLAVAARRAERLA